MFPVFRRAPAAHRGVAIPPCHFHSSARPTAVRLCRLVSSAALVVATAGASAQVPAVTFFRPVYSFTNGNDGAIPYAGPIFSGGELYGTTTRGGAAGNGTVFAALTNGGGTSVLHAFSPMNVDPILNGLTNSDGGDPEASLVLSAGVLYGTTRYGGSDGGGVVFAVVTNGTAFAVLHAFTNGADGVEPGAGLTVSGTRLFGTTMFGGASGDGTLFAVNTDGTSFTTLHGFSGADGATPLAGLTLSGNTLFGTTFSGGSDGVGTVFAVNTDGTSFRTVHSFSMAGSQSAWTNFEGAIPEASVALVGGTLFGLAAGGGADGCGTAFSVGADGTGFTVLHTFTGGGDGQSPFGNFALFGNAIVGAAAYAGASGDGVLFALSTDGTVFKVLHTFTGPDGSGPVGLALSGNTLYGTTQAGGAGTNGAGTVFAITLAPAPTIATNSVAEIDGQLQFTVVGVTPGATVYLQASADLSAPGSWVSIATNVAATTNLTINGLVVTNAAHGFFRVVETIAP